jgi:Isochorismatase family
MYPIHKIIIIMNEYITPDREHSALLIIDIQHDFTLMDAIAEIPGTLQAVQYIQCLAQVYREKDKHLHMI